MTAQELLMSENNVVLAPSPSYDELNAPEAPVKKGVAYSVTPFIFQLPGVQVEEVIENVIDFDSL